MYMLYANVTVCLTAWHSWGFYPGIYFFYVIHAVT
jgi:hypothetical protein